MERMREGKGEKAMKTLIKVLKCIGGIELHFRVEGTTTIERIWIEGGK